MAAGQRDAREITMQPGPPILAVRLTVWCKSLLFNGRGYTVYDSSGRIVFRVDNYAHDWRRESVLMDSAGRVLLTIRRCRKILGITESWEAYKGEKAVGGVGHQKPLLKATKDLGTPTCSISMASIDGEAMPQCYRMRWSEHMELSIIYAAATGAPLVAKVSRKYGVSPNTLLDEDVLSLQVQPEMDQAIVMALVMIAHSMR